MRAKAETHSGSEHIFLTESRILGCVGIGGLGPLNTVHEQLRPDL